MHKIENVRVCIDCLNVWIACRELAGKILNYRKLEDLIRIKRQEAVRKLQLNAYTTTLLRPGTSINEVDKKPTNVKFITSLKKHGYEIIDNKVLSATWSDSSSLIEMDTVVHPSSKYDTFSLVSCGGDYENLFKKLKSKPNFKYIELFTLKESLRDLKIGSYVDRIVLLSNNELYEETFINGKNSSSD
jgi:hypothetical protein